MITTLQHTLTFYAIHGTHTLVPVYMDDIFNYSIITSSPQHTCINATPYNTSLTTPARALTTVSPQELLEYYCDWSGNDYFPALVSEAIRAETFQRYSAPLNTHMKMISSTLGSRVLRVCTSPLSLLLQTPVIATTFSDRAAVCLSF